MLLLLLSLWYLVNSSIFNVIIRQQYIHSVNQTENNRLNCLFDVAIATHLTIHGAGDQLQHKRNTRKKITRHLMSYFPLTSGFIG